MSFLKLQNITKSFQGQKVLKDISIDVKKGSFVSLIGASGSGKSTLLRLLAGLEKPDSGQILWQQTPNISFVFQEPVLLPWRNIEENINLSLELTKDKSVFTIKDVLHLVGLDKFSYYYPHELSGGMKMRASLARALISSPDVLLMDEPFAALDEITRFQLQDDLLNIWSATKTTIIFVTHSISEAVYLAERVLLLGRKTFGVVFEEEIKFSYPRKQDLKRSSAYNDYVAQISSKLKDSVC